MHVLILTGYINIILRIDYSISLQFIYFTKIDINNPSIVLAVWHLIYLKNSSFAHLTFWLLNTIFSYLICNRTLSLCIVANPARLSYYFATKLSKWDCQEARIRVAAKTIKQMSRPRVLFFSSRTQSPLLFVRLNVWFPEKNSISESSREAFKPFVEIY